LYIVELSVRYVERGIIDAQIFVRQPENPRSKKVANYGINMESLRTKNAMLNQPTRKSACQFVYRISIGAICRTQNNKGSIFSPPGREPSALHVPWVYLRPTAFHTLVFLGIGFAIAVAFVLVSRYAIIKL